MSNNGLHKLIGAQFTRVQPALCGQCIHYCPLAHDIWDVCAAKQKLLSNPHAVKGSCKDFVQAPEQIATDEVITGWNESAREHQDYLKKRKDTR